MSKRRIFASRTELDATLTQAVCSQLQAGIDARGKATLVVSGGSTPKGLFSALSEADLDWKSVTVLLADDRWVDGSHADSNTAMVKSLLLTGAAEDAKWVDFGAGNADVDAELNRVKHEVAHLGTFDVVILGMGNDSHTASLFPCSVELVEGLTTDAVALMTQPTTAPHQRLSLSKSRLLDTKMGVVHIVGSTKLAVFDTATQYADDDVHPISHFYHHEQFSLWFAE